MRVLIASLAVLLSAATSAYADPPPPGTEDFVFFDPHLHNVVVCDTKEEIQTIVLAPAPEDQFLNLYLTPNPEGNPTCLAGVPKADVIDWTPVGIIHFPHATAKAYAVHVKNKPWPLWVGSYWVLYLEYNDPPVPQQMAPHVPDPELPIVGA